MFCFMKWTSVKGQKLRLSILWNKMICLRLYRYLIMLIFCMDVFLYMTYHYFKPEVRPTSRNFCTEYLYSFSICIKWLKIIMSIIFGYNRKNANSLVRDLSASIDGLWPSPFFFHPVPFIFCFFWAIPYPQQWLGLFFFRAHRVIQAERNHVWWIPITGQNGLMSNATQVNTWAEPDLQGLWRWALCEAQIRTLGSGLRCYLSVLAHFNLGWSFSLLTPVWATGPCGRYLLPCVCPYQPFVQYYLHGKCCDNLFWVICHF